MNKQLILPIIALMALLFKSVLGIELSSEEQDIIADGILALITAIGFLMQPKK